VGDHVGIPGVVLLLRHVILLRRVIFVHYFCASKNYVFALQLACEHSFYMLPLLSRYELTHRIVW
jgi:hypothetical protein